MRTTLQNFFMFIDGYLLIQCIYQQKMRGRFISSDVYLYYYNVTQTFLSSTLTKKNSFLFSTLTKKKKLSRVPLEKEIYDCYLQRPRSIIIIIG